MARKRELQLLSSSEAYGLESERDFQRRVSDAAVQMGWMVYSVPDSRRATLAGYPDLTLIHARKKFILFAELKTQKGKLRPQQETVLEALQAVASVAGSRVAVAVWRPADWPTVLQTLANPQKKQQKNGKNPVSPDISAD